jgi:hypothetical protein
MKPISQWLAQIRSLGACPAAQDWLSKQEIHNDALETCRLDWLEWILKKTGHELELEIAQEQAFDEYQDRLRPTGEPYKQALRIAKAEYDLATDARKAELVKTVQDLGDAYMRVRRDARKEYRDRLGYLIRKLVSTL